MKKSITILLCVAISLFGYSQKNIAGTWEGELHHHSGEYFNQYKITLQIQQEGDQVTGISYIEVADIYAEMSFEGTFKGNRLEFQENQILREKTPEELSWCIKQASLQFEIDNGVFKMKGPWSGNTGIAPTQSGNISLIKATPRA